MSHSQERERGAREELRDAGQVPPLPATRLSEFRVLAWLWVVFSPRRWTLMLWLQRWEAAAEEHRREARELRAEVAARDDALRKLEARVRAP